MIERTHRTRNERIRVKTAPSTEPPLTIQSAKDECDINQIMNRYRLGGEINHVNRAQAHYGDFSSGQDFTTAYTRIANAEQAFAELPAHIRDMFGNDPEAFLYKMEDPEFRKKLEEENVFDQEVGPIANELKRAPILDKVKETGDTQTSRETSDSEAKSTQPAPSESKIQGGE